MLEPAAIGGETMAFIERCKTKAKQCCMWLTRAEHREKARALYDEVSKAFTEHPRDAGETYWTHLRFTTCMSARFLYTTVVIMVHGFLPFLLTRAASDEIEATYRIMKTRIPKSRRAELDAYDDYSV